MKTYDILLVHGIGEQKRFEFLEDVAANIYRAISKTPPDRGAYLEIYKGDQGPYHAENESWMDVPVVIRWKSGSGDNQEWIRVRFREVYWADLDVPFKIWNWVRLIGWSLGISGVRPYDTSPVENVGKHMRQPTVLSRYDMLFIRIRLFLVSVIFGFMLVVNLITLLLKRIFIQLGFLHRMGRLIYNYMGDVKIYQDWYVSGEARLETMGDKTRVAIRRRMVRALIQSATSVERKEIDGYYVFSHSLGTVVAFNALMESELALPNYLTESEWNDVPADLTYKSSEEAPARQMPRRPPWLDAHDAVRRKQLFGGMRGFLTMGSPLDKFAALWPKIVWVNEEPGIPEVPWCNVADIQDVVGANLDLFSNNGGNEVKAGSPVEVGHLRLKNYNWADQKTLLTAHTSYWKAHTSRSDRLIDRIIEWLERGNGSHPNPPMDNIRPRWVGRTVYFLTVFYVVWCLWVDLPKTLASVSCVCLVFAGCRSAWEKIKFGRDN